MAREWLTYDEIAVRLGPDITAEAARQRAIRRKWPARPGNDGRTERHVDIEDVLMSAPPKARIKRSSDARSTPEQPSVDHPSDARTVEALDAHIATLKAMLAKAEQNATCLSDEAAALRGEVSRLQAKLASREGDHATEITAMSRRLIDELVATTAERESAEAARAERVRKEQVRADHDRWQARPWAFRMLIPEPPYLDMFGRISVRTPNGARLAA